MRWSVVVCAPALWLCSCAPGVPGPQVRRGVLDLTTHDWKRAPTVPLLGEFEFFWQKWLEPKADPRKDPNAREPAPSGWIAVPARWNEFEVEKRPVGGRGFGTYRLRIRIGPDAPQLGLRILHFDSAHRLFVNGRLVHEAGRIGRSAAESEGGRLPGIATGLPRDNELVLVAHVSNFQHQNGGWPRAIILGEATTIEAMRLRETLVDVFLFGGLLIMGLYHLGLYVLRREDRSPLYFALFCLITALRTLLIGERVIEQILPGIPFLWAVRIDYLAFFVSAPIFLAYTGLVFPGAFLSLVTRVLAFATAVGAVLVLTLPSYVFTRTNPAFQVITLGVGLYILVNVVRLAFYRRQGAVTFLVGFAVFFAAVLNDLMFARQWILTGYYTSYGLFAFVLAQAFLLSRRLLAAFRTAETLSVHLANSEQRYRHLVEDSGEIIVTLDDAGHIQSVNQAVRGLLGYSPEKVLGRHVADLLYGGDGSRTLFGRHVFEERLAVLRKTHTEQQFSAQFRTATSEACELSVRLQWIELHGEHTVFGNLARRAENQLARFCLEDRRAYRIPSSFSLAEIVNRSVTASLEGRLSEGDLSLIRLALREILVNAIEHGNLSISFPEKSAATEEGRLLELIAERQADARFRDRMVHVAVELSDSTATFIVRDQGAGFDHAGMLERARKQADSPELLFHGRGLAFAAHLFDTIAFNETGSEVRLTKRLPASPSRTEPV